MRLLLPLTRWVVCPKVDRRVWIVWIVWTVDSVLYFRRHAMLLSKNK